MPTSSPNNAKPHVVGSQSTSYDLEDVKSAKEFIWKHMTGYDKNIMIEMSRNEFIENPYLRFYVTAAVVKEGATSDL